MRSNLAHQVAVHAQRDLMFSILLDTLDSWLNTIGCKPTTSRTHDILNLLIVINWEIQIIANKSCYGSGRVFEHLPIWL